MDGIRFAAPKELGVVTLTFREDGVTILTSTRDPTARCPALVRRSYELRVRVRKFF